MSINRIGQNQNYINLLQQRRTAGAVNSEQKSINFKQQNAGALAVNAGVVQNPYNYETSAKGVDVVKFGELVRTNALKKSGITPATSNPITEVQSVNNPETMKVNVAQVKNIFGKQPDLANVKKFNNKMATSVYADTVSKSANSDYDKYADLAKIKLG